MNQDELYGRNELRIFNLAVYLLRNGVNLIILSITRCCIGLKKYDQSNLTSINWLPVKDLSIEARYRYRQEHSLPVVEAFSAWLEKVKEKVLPKSTLGKAIEYSISQLENLKNFLLDGRLEIDNNRAERLIKPFMIRRRGWLFSNTPKGAKSSAILYSIIETVKENNLKPYEYLKYVLETIPYIDVSNKEEVDKLLPWSKMIPEEYRMKK